LFENRFQIKVTDRVLRFGTGKAEVLK